MRINNNITAMNTQRQLSITNTNTGKSMEKLSSGYRINRAGDDAAGLAISEKMRAQIRGLNQASRNSQDGISLIQTAEGALSETHDILQRMRELATQAATGTNGADEISKINDEVQQLISEIDRIGEKTTFNSTNIIATDQTITLQVGANENDTMDIDWKAQTSAALGEDAVDLSALAFTDSASAQTALTTLDSAIESVSKSRSKMGAFQNRLEHTIKNLDNASENLSSAESRIRDTDMAKEMVTLTKNNILSQAATSMLAQANQAPQSVLSLLQ